MSAGPGKPFPMASQTVGSHILERLRAHGVCRVYGYPGDGINGILGGFHEHGDEIEFIQAAHEELAAFMACAQAKFSGDVGVCLATSGPGAIHLLNGLYDAKLDHQPVVAIVGQQASMSLGAATSKRSTWSRCSRTSRVSTSRWRPRPRRSRT